MCRKWYFWFLIIVLVVSLFFWLDAELNIMTSTYTNDAWTMLAADKAKTVEGESVLAVKRILISDLTPEKKFADLMIVSKSYPRLKSNYENYYQLYWLAISDTKTGDRKTDEVLEATRRLLFVDNDIGQKLTDMSMIVGYDIEAGNISDFGSKFGWYVDNRFTTEDILLKGLDYKTLLVPVDRTWEYLWIVSLIAFLGLMYMAVIDEISKKKMRQRNKIQA